MQTFDVRAALSAQTLVGVPDLASRVAAVPVAPRSSVAVTAADPVDVLVACMAAWLADATPVVGPSDTLPPAGAGLVVVEPLVGAVAHPMATLGRLTVPDVDELHVVADWRVDVWVPLALAALRTGRIRVTLLPESPGGGPAPTSGAGLACPAALLARSPQLAEADAFASWVTWGGGLPTTPPADRHVHAFGDHFVVGTSRRSVVDGDRGWVPGRHRVCNPAGRPLPDNAWGLLALAGELPTVASTPTALDAPGERTWLTDYRARRRPDGSIEFDQRVPDPTRVSGRRLDPVLVAELLSDVELPGGVLTARDQNRLVLHVTGPADTTALERLTAALPAWAGPVGVVTVPTFPRTETGAVDLPRLALAAWPDTRLLSDVEHRLGVTLRTVTVPPETTRLPLPDDFAAGGAHYPAARPAHVVGKTLPPQHDDLLDRLCRAADLGTGILIVDADGHERDLPYRELLADAARIATHLTANGVAPGDELIVHCGQTADLFAGIWAAVMVGALPLPLTPPSPYDAASNPLWHLLGHDSMLTRRTVLTTEPQHTTTEAHLRTRGLTAEFLDLEAARRERPLPRDEWTPRPPALMLLTSGSTGAPKGVVLSHRNLVSLAEAVGAEFGLDGETSVNWLAVDHVGGLVQHHMRDLCLANRQLHVDTGYVLADPTRLLDLCAKHRVTVTWMANFGFNLVNECADAITHGHWDLSAIKVWENGGESVTHDGNQRFLTLLAPHGLRPDVIRPVFGMTETSSAVIAAHNLVAGRADNVHWLADTALDRPVVRALPGEGSPFVEVGTPMAGLAMRVVDAEGNVCQEGVSGRIEVSGPQVTAGYHNNPAANAETFTADGWLRMGDCGFVVDGSLVVTGREKDVIIVNGLNYAARALESTVEALPGIRQGCCAAVPVRRPEAATDDLVVFYSGDADPAAAEAALIAEHNLRPVAMVELSPQAWPRTAIGKIRRSVLARGFVAGEFADLITLRRDGGLGERPALPGWHFAPQWQPTAPPPSGARRVLWLGADAPPGTTPVPDPEELPAVLAASGAEVVVDARRRTVPVGAEPEVAALVTAHREWDALCRAAAGVAVPPAVVLATEAAFAVTGRETGIVHAALPGLAQSLAQAHPRLSVTLVDGAPVEVLPAEGGGVPVAYRDGTRLTPVLRPVPAASVPDKPRRVLRDGGHYLVVGGLGGVGAHLCRHLLRRFGARLLVVGRGPATGTRAQTLAYLSAHGDLRYRTADATDPDALAAALREAEHDWGTRVDAVFTLAGEGSIAERLDVLQGAGHDRDADERAERAAADRIRICHSLDAVLADRPTPVVTFSSVNGFFGGAGFAHYAGACAYQAAHAATSGRDDLCLDWSRWQQVGMAAGTPTALAELAARRGFAGMTPTQGLASLHVALDWAERRLLIGLDPAGTEVLPLLPFGTATCLVEATGAEPNDVATLLDLPPAQVRVGSGTQRRGTVPAPRTEALLEVFRAVLANPDLTEDDNFFASGGDSIRAIQVVARAAERDLRFSPLDLFEHQTVATLLEHLAELDPAAIGVDGEDATGPVPLPPVFSWWLETGDPAATRRRLTMSTRYAVTATPTQLEAALGELVDRHEALRLRLVDRTLDVADADNLRFEVVDGPVSAEAVEDRLHLGLDPATGPIVHAAYLRDARQLVLVVHHAAVDGVSWRVVEDDLRALLAGTPLPPAHGYLDWARRLARRTGELDGRALADAWLARVTPSTPFPPAPTLHERDARILTRTLGAGRHGGVHEALLTAVGWSLGSWTGTDTVTVDVEGHGRLQHELPVDLSRSVGWFTAIAPLSVHLHTTPEETLRHVRRSVTDQRGRDIEWGILQHRGADQPLAAFPPRQVSVNYLGVFDGDGEPDPVLTAVPGSLRAEFDPAATRHYLIDVAAQVSGGELELSVKYSPEVHATADVERWLDECVAVLDRLLGGDEPVDIDPEELLLALEEVGFA
ncbi:SDR family NAD(P)-dependent oxidoreductase [Actinophytocola oryzae]|uniref:SDR family NAD(P)-dependent oxidoreductase n=1 Tax=Actinophytocola oryzae TaxID=502181 RepID=UPI0010642F2D|nr:SDR family NAD(P)-dependent oxidoreductase [Actinophytocola oryzae]